MNSPVSGMLAILWWSTRLRSVRSRPPPQPRIGLTFALPARRSGHARYCVRRPLIVVGDETFVPRPSPGFGGVAETGPLS